jgi:hypothetical protein
MVALEGNLGGIDESRNALASGPDIVTRKIKADRE